MYSGTSIGGVKMTENEKRMRRVCFTGHRPEKLTRSENTIKRELEKQKERIRLENEVREKEIKIRDVLRNELKAAVSEINRNKEVTKFNPIFGEVNADASVSRLKYNIFAEIKVTLYLMHKSTVIGRLVEATRSISTLADDNELNAAFLKKKIMSVAKSPVQDLLITTDGAMHIYEMTCKYLKKQKDMKADENLWLAADESKRQILRLMHTVSSRKMQTSDCYVGDFLNSKFKNGCIHFVLNNYSFAYDIANDSVTMDEQQKTELCLLAKRLNAQKKTIKICQKTIESLQQAEGLQDDLNMSYALKDENIVIRGKHCLGKLIIAPGEKITGTEIKKWLKNSRKEYELEQKRKQEEKEAELRSLQSYGSLMAIDALRLIAQNERYITENAVVKNLRGMSQTLQSDIKDIENSGKYGLLTGEEVKKTVHILDNDGLIYQQEIEGTYGWFYILKLRDKAKDLLSVENKQEKKPFGEFTDLDWVNYLEKFHADGKEPRLTNIQKNEQITFFEHKSVAILYPELVKEFLKTKPKEWQMYIETMYSMAAGVEKKYWKFLRDMAVEKKERKKKLKQKILLCRLRILEGT